MENKLGADCSCQHKWSKYWEKEANCSQICLRCHERKEQPHDWDGCICKICGKKRDEQHDWEEQPCGCKKCRKCGQESHKDNVGIEKDVDRTTVVIKCSVCGGQLGYRNTDW